jgi:rhodanese-related sulfurtransferase
VEELRADRAVVALGVRPAVAFAAAAGLEVGPRGGLVVDDRLRTGVPQVHAGGDCVEVTCAVTGRPNHVPLGSLANRQGRVIGDDLAGVESRFGPVAGSACVQVFDTNVAATGLRETAARRAGLEARAVWGTFQERAHYYPEAPNVYLKLVYEADTHRVLGVQGVGPGDVVKRVDVAAGVIRRRGTLADLLDAEFCYSPPYNAALDPLHGLAAAALNQERFGIRAVAPDADPGGRAVVDVRQPHEIDEKRPLLDGAVNIAVEELRDRVDELPRDRPVLVVCEKGVRSAEAARWLQTQGFDGVTFLAGGASMRFAAARTGA